MCVDGEENIIVAVQETPLSTTILFFSVLQTSCCCLNIAPACSFIVAQNWLFLCILFGLRILFFSVSKSIFF